MLTAREQSIVTARWESPIIRCPLFTQAAADWLRPVEGFCRARRDGQLTIPSISQYHRRCTSADYALCEVRHG